jgi:Putative prokaryotic signal transducing protein
MAGYVTVHRTYDPLLAEMLGDLLRQEGIDARVLGSQASAIFGAAQSFLQTRIDVPEADAARAQEVIVAVQTEEDEPERPVLAPEVEAPPRLSAVRALGIAPLIPGGGHFVARRAFVGGAVLLAQLVAIAAMVAGDARQATAGAITAVGLLLFDVIGGALAVRAFNRGARVSHVRQMLTALLALFGLGAAGAVLAPAVMRLKPAHRAADEFDDHAIRPGQLTPNDLPFPLRPDPWAGR